MAEHGENQYIVSLDIGTSNLRSLIYDKYAAVVGKSTQPLKLVHPELRAVEIEPDTLFHQVCDVIKKSIENANVNSCDIKAMGMSLQRGTFILWHKDTGKPLHNFMVWQDTRCETMEKEWNQSYSFKLMRSGSKILHSVSRKNRFMATSVIKLRSNHVSIRLHWLLETHPDIKKLADDGKVQLGTLETWLIWKFTNGKVFASEMSMASCTGIYDPYAEEWSSILCSILRLPLSAFPPVWDTDADYGSIDEKYFGSPILLRAPLGDQQASFYGHTRYEVGDCKLTMGTGAFMCINVGNQAHASVQGFYPVTWYRQKNKTVYLAEGSVHTCGDAVEWLIQLGFCNKANECESLALSVPDSKGVYFIPAFHGLQAPTNDFSACGCLIGLTAEATKAHITRAVLESLAFKNKDMYDAMCTEIKHKPKVILCDGGVCSNNFIMQLTADIIGLPIKRGRSDMGSLGAAFAAGLAIGYWKDENALKDLVKPEKTFEPNSERGNLYKETIKHWKEAVKRSLHWYKN